ncbi:hypothetical protein [Streptomyces sp. NPDC057094]
MADRRAVDRGLMDTADRCAAGAVGFELGSRALWTRTMGGTVT